MAASIQVERAESGMALGAWFDRDDEAFLCTGSIAGATYAIVGKLTDDGKIKAGQVTTPGESSSLFMCTQKS